MREIKIVFFGDSIINGKGVSVHKTFVCMLSKYLEEKWVNVVVTMISRNGDTTRDALEKIHYLFNTPYDIVVIQFGLNDCNRWKTESDFCRVFPDSFEANLKEIILRLRKCNVGKIFVCTNHSSTKEGFASDNENYNVIIRRVCSQLETTIIDMGAFLSCAGITNHVLADGVHLSEYGHLVYYSTIKPYLDFEIKTLIEKESL